MVWLIHLSILQRLAKSCRATIKVFLKVVTSLKSWNSLLLLQSHVVMPTEVSCFEVRLLNLEATSKSLVLELRLMLDSFVRLFH